MKFLTGQFKMFDFFKIFFSVLIDESHHKDKNYSVFFDPATAEKRRRMGCDDIGLAIRFIGLMRQSQHFTLTLIRTDNILIISIYVCLKIVPKSQNGIGGSSNRRPWTIMEQWA